MPDDLRQADAIVITPAMMGAGRDVLSLAFLNGELSDGETELAVEVFRAMIAASDDPKVLV